jgi:hypothetical protein
MKVFILSHDQARRRAAAACMEAAAGDEVRITAPKRNSDQNAKFHALCSDIAKSGFRWAGKPRTDAEWKVLLVSGHAAATKEGFDMVPGLENEYVNLRESTALMSKSRSASLIEYTLAFCANNEIPIHEPATA